MKTLFSDFKSPIFLLALLISYSQVNAQHKSDSTKKAVRFAGLPIITYNRTQGIYLGAMTSAFYKVNNNDTISPPSSTALVGLYTQEKSWMFGGMQQLYLNEDTWRIRFAGVRGNINFQFYNGDTEANTGGFENYSNDIVMVQTQVQRKIWNRIYGGVFAEYNNTKTYFTSQGDSLDERNMSNLGYIFSMDTRDNVYFPTKGVYANFKHQFYRDWLGTTNNFVRFKVNLNKFFDLLKDQRHILVARANLEIATGDVPFQGQGIVGMEDIRGYSEGKYRANQIYAIQSEYRWMFNNSRFGMVGFFGIASAVESFSDIFNSTLLPGGGAGIRYRMIPAMKINIGIDVGFGKDDYSLSFKIGESFAR